MRVFLSVYPGFTLAIPMDAVGSMMLYDQKTERTVQYDQKNRCTFISLPKLFSMPDQDVQHGVIMREWNSKENKVVLLTAEVKRDIEIHDKEFHPMPKTLGAMRFSSIFSGIHFSGKPVLLLNVEHLAQIIQMEQQATNEKTNPPEQPAPDVISETSPTTSIEIIDEQPTASHAENSETSLKIPNEVIDEQPASTEETPETSSTSPNEAIDEQPASIEATSEASSTSHNEVIDEQPIKTKVTSKPFSTITKEIIEEFTDIFASSSLAVDDFFEVINEPPASPTEISKPSPSSHNEIINQQPASPAVVSKPAPVTHNEVIDKPPANTEVISKPSYTTPKVEKFAGNFDYSSITIDEVIVICDIFDKPTTSHVEISEPSSTSHNEIINQQPASPAVVSKPSPTTHNEVIDKQPASPAVVSKPSPATHNEVINKSSSPAVISKPSYATPKVEKSAENYDYSSITIDEVIVICDIFD